MAERPSPCAVMIGFDVLDRIVASSVMYMNDPWTNAQHRSFCTRGGGTAKTRKVSIEEASRIFDTHQMAPMGAS